MLVFAVPGPVRAESLQEKIDRLNKEIQQNMDTANVKHKEADSIKEVLQIIEDDISGAQKALDLTSTEVAQTNIQIDEANENLNKQLAILRDNIRQIYREGKISPIEVIASSKSLSDFVSQQQYLGAIKRKVDDNILKIDQLKKELESKKGQLVALQTKQKGQVDSIAAKKAQQSELLAKTQADEAGYKATASQLEADKRKAAQQIAAQLSSATSGGSFVSQGHVSAGQQIGWMGSTGNSSGTHLHFSVIKNGAFVNPGSTPYSWESVTNGVQTSWYTSEHNGIDVANPTSPPVKAAADGEIIERVGGCVGGYPGNRCNGGWGNYIAIYHPSTGYVTWYAHLLPF